VAGLLTVPIPADRRLGGLGLPVSVALGCLVVGELATATLAPLLHNRMGPWIVGRGLGLAAYLALTALVVVGTWFRHPWRIRRPLLHPAMQLRTHAALAVATLALVAGHTLALVLDPYAGVGWVGAMVPGAAHYRPVAIALGTLGLYTGIVVGASAALAGRVGRGSWHGVHRLAAVAFALVWVHAVLAGSDTLALRVMYLATGALVIGLTASSRLAGQEHPAGAAGVPAAAPRRVAGGPLPWR